MSNHDSTLIADRTAVRLGRAVTARPWLVLALSLLWVALAASGARLLGFTNDYRVFFSEENPQLLAFEAVEKTYTKFDNVLFVVAPDAGDIYTPETLAAIAYLTEASWQMPYSIRVDSLTNFQHSFAEGDDLVVEDLVPPGDRVDAARANEIRDIARVEPMLFGQLVSRRDHTAGVNVTVQLPGVDLNVEVPEVARAARAIAEEFRARYPDHQLHLTGVSMLNNAFSEASQQDMQTLIPLSFAVILVLIGGILRRFAGTFATFWVVALSIAAAMGCAGWLGIPLTPASVTAPVIILTLAVADSVHILTNYLQRLGAGDDRREAMVESLRINLQPVFLTSVTTAIGFLSMNFSDAPPFRDLGNICAIGVMAALVLSVTLLPALVVLMPASRESAGAAGGPAFQPLAELVIRRRRALVFGVGAVIAGVVTLIPLNEINDRFVEYFDTSIPFRVASDFASENLVGVYRIEYSLESGESGGIAEPGFMARVEQFANWYRGQRGVQHVAVYTDIMKRLNRNMHGDDPGYERLPDSRELAAQYLLLYEMSLPYGLDLNNQINVDKSAVRLIASIENLSVNETLALEQAAGEWLAANAPALRTEGTGPSIMFGHITRRNITTMLGGTTLALVLISVLLVVALRSPMLGLVSVIPNLAPVAMAFGLWAVLDGQVGLSLSVVAGMTLGIVVDDTVHFLSKYLRARRERGLDPADSVRYAFATVGRALWVTTIVLVAGFLVLTLSAFEINAGMGLMTAMTIALALFVDFLFLPPLLMLLEERSDAISMDAAGATGADDT